MHNSMQLTTYVMYIKNKNPFHYFVYGHGKRDDDGNAD